MKIKFDRLSQIYLSYIIKATPLTRENCPPVEILSESLLGKISKKNQKLLIEHISQCGYCLAEFQFILEVKKENKKLIQKISYLLSEKSEKKQSKKIGYNFTFFHKMWNWAFLTTGIILIAVSGLVLYVLINGGLKQQFRGTSIDHIKLIQPVNNTKSKIPVRFNWKKIENSEYYILEIFDDTLLPIWKSPKTSENRILLPKDISETLVPDKIYYWFVTAFLHGDKKIESSIEPFRLIK